MIFEGRSRIELINGDSMEALEKMEENQFDLAIVDPPVKDSGKQLEI